LRCGLSPGGTSTATSGLCVLPVPGAPPARSGFSYKSSLELRDQSSQGFRLLIRGEVTAGQPLNLEAEVAQSFLREIDLPVFKGIFVAATHQAFTYARENRDRNRVCDC